MSPKSVALAIAVFFSSCACQAATLYVSGAAPSSNIACTAAAPCNNLVKALDAAFAGDTIVCVTTPANSGGLFITKSIAVDCSSARAPLRDGGAVIPQGGGSTATAGAFINIPVSSTDPLRTVRLRGLTIDGGGFGAGGRFTTRGIEIQSATTVHIEDCVIANVIEQGINDRRTSGQTKLFVKDSTISGGTGPGIVAAQTNGVTVVDNVRVENNSYGIAAATGNDVFVNRSIISGNTAAGVEADVGARVDVSNSAITHNNVGVQAFGAIRLRENDIKFNATAIQGAPVSFGANRFYGNGAAGTMPSLVSGAPADLSN